MRQKTPINEPREDFAAVLAVLMRIESRLARIEAALSLGDSQADVALAEAIAEASAGLEFTAADLIETAGHDEALGRALKASLGTVNGRVLGRWISQMEGLSLGGICFVRSRGSRVGQLWTCDSEKTLTRGTAAKDDDGWRT
jgi:hypothetical protein